MVDLGTLGGAHTDAIAMNASGQVCGTSWVNGIERHAFFYSGSLPIVDCGTLGGTHSGATAMNDNGDVVGWSDISGDVYEHAFYVDYQNRKQDYVNKFVEFLDWDELARRYQVLAG